MDIHKNFCPWFRQWILQNKSSQCPDFPDCTVALPSVEHSLSAWPTCPSIPTTFTWHLNSYLSPWKLPPHFLSRKHLPSKHKFLSRAICISLLFPSLSTFLKQPLPSLQRERSESALCQCSPLKLQQGEIKPTLSRLWNCHSKGGNEWLVRGETRRSQFLQSTLPVNSHLTGYDIFIPPIRKVHLLPLFFKASLSCTHPSTHAPPASQHQPKLSKAA